MMNMHTDITLALFCSNTEINNYFLDILISENRTIFEHLNPEGYSLCRFINDKEVNILILNVLDNSCYTNYFRERILKNSDASIILGQPIIYYRSNKPMKELSLEEIIDKDRLSCQKRVFTIFDNFLKEIIDNYPRSRQKFFSKKPSTKQPYILSSNSIFYCRNCHTASNRKICPTCYEVGKRIKFIQYNN